MLSMKYPQSSQPLHRTVSDRQSLSSTTLNAVALFLATFPLSYLDKHYPSQYCQSQSARKTYMACAWHTASTHLPLCMAKLKRASHLLSVCITKRTSFRCPWLGVVNLSIAASIGAEKSVIFLIANMRAYFSSSRIAPNHLGPSTIL